VQYDYHKLGHETNFALFLLCLVKLRVVDESELSALVLRVFAAYVKTMRKLQQTYLLEPAGSHGVWGLDDYHCLIYVWGSAQVMPLN
jgi:serine/threonine-protein phosphatase 2A activator